MTKVLDVDAAHLLDFIRVPGRLATRDPAWIEPLRFERRQFLSPKHNRLYDHAEIRLWIAERAGETVGRISAQVDRLAPPGPGGEKIGFFGMIAADGEETLRALLATAEAWLAEQNVKLVRGPFSLSVNQTSGLLVQGFDTPPYVMMDHHPEWLGQAVEASGYAPAQDLVAYVMDTVGPLPAKERRLVERDWPGLLIRSLDMRRYRDEITTVTTIFNDAWSNNWGFIPLTEAEIDAMATELKPILDPELVKIAEIDGEPVAFLVLLPNVNEAIADLDGRLLPFGWAKLLWRLKVQGIKTGRVPLMGVRRDFADTLVGKTLPLRLIYAVEDRVHARGIREIELSWLLEDNWPVRRVIERLGGQLSKVYRIYEKRLP
ncbi:MAG: dATP pyrophosphohydrolase [Pseudomonadota bacterium]